MIVTIEGNIGAGKTTLTNTLCEELRRVIGKTVHLIKEPVEEWKNVEGNNILKTFYEDKVRWGFTFQVNAFVDTVINEFKAYKSSLDGDIVVMERSSFSVLKFFTSLLESENDIQKMEGDILKKLRRTFPDILLNSKNVFVFYLKTDPEVCFERILKRGRQEEVGASSLEYLQKLHYIHEQEILPEKVNGQLLQILDGQKRSWKIQLENQNNIICLELDISKELM